VSQVVNDLIAQSPSAPAAGSMPGWCTGAGAKPKLKIQLKNRSSKAPLWRIP
jgi:hypothetical protein